MKKILKKILRKNLSTTTILIYNCSKLHFLKKTHSHYKLIVVSKKFYSLSLFRRQQLIHLILKNNNISIYSIDLYTYTPIEWNSRKHNEIYTSYCVHNT